MPPLPSRLTARAQEALSAELYRAGHTPKSLEETQRDVLWWVYARVQAVLNLTPRLLEGWGIAWTSAGYAELVPTEVPPAGRDRVTVQTIFSAVSPGTERAQYLHLPNAQVGLLGRPGYSAGGIVHSVGRDVTRFRRGDLVAVTGAPHASIVTVPERQVFGVPRDVPLEQAALIMLGIICVHGANLAAPGSEDRVAVIGAGPIGILAFRIACLTGTPLAVVASSQRRVGLAAASEAPLLTVGEDAAAISRLGASVVIEATGDPQAISVAISAAGEGSRVVLLGSPRGVTRELPISEIREKRLRLIGAHVDTLELDRAGEQDARRNAGDRFLELLSSHALLVEDLLGPTVDPRRAAVFYRELAEGRHTGGARFDWRQLGRGERVHRGHLLGPPNISGRGMEATRPYRPNRKRGSSSIFELPDPFAGLQGHLRLGMLGCGDIAIHNSAGAAAAPNVEVTACFDPISRLADDLAARHGARAVDTQEELLASADVDAVLISVPHHLHSPLAIAACEAGKHVIVEKPPANDLAGAIAMARAAEQNGVSLSTCFPQRYEPKVQVARRLIELGALGEVEGTLTRLFLDKSPAYWLGGFSGRARSDWRSSKKQAGGGVLIMNLSHHIDLIRYLSGLEVELVSALARPVDEIEDTAVASLRYAGGALGSVVGCSAVRGSAEQGMSLWGSEGRIVLEPDPRVYTLRPLDGLRTTRWHSFGRLPSARIRAIYLSRLADAICTGRSPDVTAQDGIAVQATIEAIYRSAQEQSPVEPQRLVSEHERVMVPG